MPTSILLGYCKCGVKRKLYQSQEGAWAYCPKRRPWNFWKHNKVVQHLYTNKEKWGTLQM